MEEELQLDLSLDQPGEGFTPDEAAASLAFATQLGEGMMPQAETAPEGGEEPQEAPQDAPPGRQGAGDLNDGNMATQDDVDALRQEIADIRAELDEDEPTKPEAKDGQAEESETTEKA